MPLSFLWQGEAFRKRKDAPRHGQAENSGSFRTEAEGSKVRATGRKKREAAAQAKAEPTFLLGSGGTRSPRAEGTAKGHEEASLHRRPIGNRNSKPQGSVGRNPPGNRRPAARQGSEPAGTGTGSAMILAKEPEGPTGAARPRPEPPWERRSRLRGQNHGPGDSGGRQQCRPPFHLGPGAGQAPPPSIVPIAWRPPSP